MGRSAKECDSVRASMLRATCALLAVLIAGVAACTFDRSGSLPGQPPAAEGRAGPDAMGMEERTPESDAASSEGEKREAGRSADAPADGSPGETDVATDAGLESDTPPSDASVMSDAPPNDGPAE